MFNVSNDKLYNLEEESCERILKMQNSYLLDATLEALKTGDLAPIIKEELKYTIQSRRLAKGQQELKVDFPEEVKYELTEEEKDKVSKRREQNRQAAQRFRDRKKSSSKSMSRQIQLLESDNKTKQLEILKLRKEKAELQTVLQEHLSICPHK